MVEKCENWENTIRHLICDEFGLYLKSYRCASKFFLIMQVQKMEFAENKSISIYTYIYIYIYIIKPLLCNYFLL